MVENTLFTPSRPVLHESRAWLTACAVRIHWQQPLAVGFSGGADSTALLLLLAAQHPNIEAWHIDHGWHQHSAAQAETLAQQCAQWGIPFRSIRISCSHTNNRESSARIARMQAFTELATTHGITQLALAHHRDDQAETVLMRMLHGDGVRGCCGMAPQQTIQAIQLLRPLLAISRKQIEQALTAAGVDWLHDPSNLDTTLIRNHLRLRLIPTMTAALQAEQTDATTLILRWQQQATMIANAIAQQSCTIAIRCHADGVSIAWQPWCAHPPSVRAWTLQRMAQALHGNGACMGRRHIMLVETWLKQGGHRGIDLSKCRLEHQKQQLWLIKTGQKHPQSDIVRSVNMTDFHND
ncbi:MAG: tRNA lysidine(34) synthetase TilS [Mariprofundales bacterium]